MLNRVSIKSVLWVAAVEADQDESFNESETNNGSLNQTMEAEIINPEVLDQEGDEEDGNDDEDDLGSEHGDRDRDHQDVISGGGTDIGKHPSHCTQTFMVTPVNASSWSYCTGI